MGHRFQRRAAAHREGGPGRRWLRLGVAGALGAALFLIASGGLVSYATAKRGRSAPRAASALPRGTSTSNPIYLDTTYSFAERAADLVSRMTLAEKVAQLSTTRAPAIPRLGVQQYTYQNEGQHGVNYLGGDENGGNGGSPNATSFPTNFASSMSWDPSL